MRYSCILSCIFLLIFSTTRLAAQDPGGDAGAKAPAAAPVGGGAGGGAMAEISSGLKSDIQLIMYAGIGGAILGLSTLSFVDKPSKELKRVTIGFALGAIVASIYVLYAKTSSSMTGGGISTLGAEPPILPVEEYGEEEGVLDDGEEELQEEEENYDDDFYGSINSFYLASVGKRGFKLGFPLVDIAVNENDKVKVTANIFRMTF